MVLRNWNVPVQTPTGVKNVKVGPCADRRDAAEHAKTAFGPGSEVDLSKIVRVDPVAAGDEVPEPAPVDATPFTDFAAENAKKTPKDNNHAK